MSLLQHKRRKRPELNLVPLIDVLVMLIFFAFVTMQFKSASTLNITLPKVETAGKNEFRGTQNVLRHFVPAMVARKTGVIVNFTLIVVA